jgi:hypothetical protein
MGLSELTARNAAPRFAYAEQREDCQVVQTMMASCGSFVRAVEGLRCRLLIDLLPVNAQTAVGLCLSLPRGKPTQVPFL